MRQVALSTDVFARIWSLREDGEDSEDSILRRVLWTNHGSSESAPSTPQLPQGLRDHRFGVTFPDGFQIERIYLGKKHRASVVRGQWVIEGIAERFSTLNELSRAIGTKTENAWVNWYFVDASGRRRPVSDLREPSKVASRSRAPIEEEATDMNTTSAVGQVRWCDDVRAALIELGGRAPLAKIYAMVEKIRLTGGRSTPPSLEEVVRKELEVRSSDSEVYDADRGEDWFEMPEGKGSGIWAIRCS
jgi:hypothetical protein